MQSQSYMCNTGYVLHSLQLTLLIEAMMSESITLEKLYEKLQQINDKLDRLLQEKKPSNIIDSDILESLDVMTLLSLPDHLRMSASTLFELGKATADEVSNVTSKERAVESNYLNQLVRMGHVEKFREGRKVYFRINERSEINK